MRKLIEGSEIIETFKKDRVQDAYSLRCLPRFRGKQGCASHRLENVINIDINSVTDNPMISTRTAKRSAEAISTPADRDGDGFLGIAVAELANISERRIARLVTTSSPICLRSGRKAE
jgi:histidine ammonia-lyase